MIKTSITLTDNFSPTIANVTSAINRSISAMEGLHNSVRTPLISSGASSLEAGLHRASQASQTLDTKLGEMGRQIQNNANKQDNFNRKIREGINPANKLLSTIKSAVGVYLSLQGVKMVLNVSDNLTMTTARLKMMVSEGENVDEVMNKIYASAQRGRASFADTANAVAKLGNTARDAFSSTDEIIAFSEQLNKQFVMAGTDASGVSAAMLQLTQAMGAGVLRGEEFNSIVEQAPPIIDLIAKRMGVTRGEMKGLASEGKITANIIKEAVLGAVEDTNARFESMPMTFSQAWTRVKNTALMAFKPVLDTISSMANSPEFQNMLSSIEQGIIFVANAVNGLFNLIAPIGKFIADNFSVVGPILMGVTAAFAVLTVATLAQKAASALLNKTLWASPLTWFVIGIIAVISVVIAATNAIAEFTGWASSGFGIICGWVNVLMQFFVNLWHLVLNVCEGIRSAIDALGYNMETAFSNSINNIKGFFYSLLSTALTIVADIGNALNKLPFITIDTSGVSSKAAEYANKSAEAYGKVREYKDIGAEFMAGFNTHDAFEKGWVDDAFRSGAAWGDNLFKPGDFSGGSDLVIPDIPAYSGAGALDGIGSGVKDIAGNTGAIKDTLDIAEEDLKYLRDIAERETINRFTTAEIKVDMGGITNNVSSGTDLDGIIDKLTTGVYDAMSKAAEGIHV